MLDWFYQRTVLDLLHEDGLHVDQTLTVHSQDRHLQELAGHLRRELEAGVKQVLRDDAQHPSLVQSSNDEDDIVDVILHSPGEATILLGDTGQSPLLTSLGLTGSSTSSGTEPREATDGG